MSVIEVDDVAFQRAYREALGEIMVEDEARAEKLALRIAELATRKAPVRTGNLRRSIQAGRPSRDAQGAFVDVGTEVEYAPFVEYGTSRQMPEPFMRPAIEQASSEDLWRKG